MLTEGGQLPASSQARWRSRVGEFFQKQHGKARPLKDPGTANCYDLQGWDHAWQVTCGVGLAAFVAETPCRALDEGERRFWVGIDALPPALQSRAQGRVRRACLELQAKTTRLEVLWEKPRAILHSWLDMGSTGWPAKHAAYCGWHMRGSFGFDPAHRRHDNLLNAMAAAGLGLMKLECLVVQTFTSGPFHQDGNFRKLEEATREWVDNFDESDPLFQTLYPRICRDMGGGRLPPEYGSAAHMAEVFKSLPGIVSQCVYGLNTKMNRWFQLLKRHRTMKQSWSVALAAGMYACIQAGHFRSVHDSPLLQHQLPNANAAAAVALAAGEPAARCSRSVKWSNEELKKLRSSCSTGFHLATTILCMDETRAVMTGVAAIARPIEEEHALAITAMKTRMGTKAWRCRQASGAVSAPMLQAWAALCDQGTLLDVGLLSFEDGASSCPFGDDAASRVACSLVDFCREMVYGEIVFQRAYCEDLPNRFCSLVDDSAQIRQDAAAWLWRVFEEVTELEAAGQGDAWLASYAKQLLWTSNTWCREVCVALGECGGERLPDDVRCEVEHFALGHGTTKANEDLFNTLRRAAKMGPKGSMSGSTMWHTSLTSPIMAESEMRTATPSQEDAVAAKGVAGAGVPQNMFDARAVSDFSLGAEKLKQYKDGGWPSPSPERFLLRPQALHSLLLCGRDFGQLKLLWQSLLVEPGYLLLRKEQGEKVSGRHWVLKATEYGVVSWKYTFKKIGSNGMKVVVPRSSCDDEGQPWEQVPVWDHSVYHAVAVNPLPPTVAKHVLGLSGAVPAAHRGVVLQVSPEGPEPLVKHAARHAFRRLTIPNMEKLVTLCKVPYLPPRPTTERGLAELLVRWQFPQHSDEQVEAILQLRSCRPQPRHDAVLAEENAEVVEGLVREDDAPAVKAAAKSSTCDKSPAPKRALKSPAGADGSSASSSCAAGSSSAAAPAVRRPIPPGTYDAAGARQFLPSATGVWIGIHSNAAWLVKYPLRPQYPRSHTVKWDDAVPGRSHFDCLVQCLEWVWQRHTELTSETCPWKFSAAPL